MKENHVLKKQPFCKDFYLVLMGQIISLFGNQILRFALPLYLLNQTKSAALFGIVSACSFFPMILLSPIGGIIADRVNKKNIMVFLDFSTAALTLVFTLLLGKINLVGLLLVTLAILYGIQGAYQPAVQASIPQLVTPNKILQANAMINLVNSLAGLIGPVIGGALYAFFGISPILYVSILCFLTSAIMELFIHIPFTREKTSSNMFKLAISDLSESFSFMRHKQPILWKVSLIIAAINLFLSALIIIGLPIIVTQTLSFDSQTGSRLYGYSQGALAAGSLAGGILTSMLTKKLNAENNYILLLLCTLTLLPIGTALAFSIPPIYAYFIIVISCFFMMLFATLFSIRMMAYLQILTPSHLIGKVISCALCIGMCASPLGQALYGTLFQFFSKTPYIIFFGATVVSCMISLVSKNVFAGMNERLTPERTY
ncbi:MAG: MFS transporter [Velocimicrobium sp.]